MIPFSVSGGEGGPWKISVGSGSIDFRSEFVSDHCTEKTAPGPLWEDIVEIWGAKTTPKVTPKSNRNSAFSENGDTAIRQLFMILQGGR